MKRVRTVLVSILAGVISLASISCACASPVAEPATAPAPYVHHHDGAATESPDCVDGGCGGNGGFDAVLPPAAKAFADAQGTPVDDDAAAVVPAIAGASCPPAAFRDHHPPLVLERACSTPVSRFDRLLS